MNKFAILYIFVGLLSLAKGNTSLTLNKETFQQILKDGNITDISETETKKRSSFKLVVEKINVLSVDWNDAEVESIENVIKITINDLNGEVGAQYQAEKKMKLLGRWRKVWKSDRGVQASFSDAKLEMVAAMTESGVKIVSCHSSIPKLTVTMPRGKSLLEKAKKLVYKPILKKIATPLKNSINNKLCPTLSASIETQSFVVERRVPAGVFVVEQEVASDAELE